ncbi:MAG: hypothetical protein MUE33_01365 [Cytophagaceae bacterium]|nr:hypothetical protein [Cytophagaceae bacterium]
MDNPQNEPESTPTSIPLIDSQQLESIWNAYAIQLKEEGKANEHVTLYQKKLTISEDNTIQVTLDNELQVEWLEQMKLDLLNYLKQALQVPSLRISTTVIQRTVEQKMYTDTDKLKFLSEQYPLVEELKKRFGLESNY